MTLNLRTIVRVPQRMLWAFVMESKETKEMLHIFARQGKKILIVRSAEGPSEEEMKKAVEQLKDIPRILPFFILIVVPAPGVTEGYVLLAITLEKWLGQKVNLLPSHFKNILYSLIN